MSGKLYLILKILIGVFSSYFLKSNYVLNKLIPRAKHSWCVWHLSSIKFLKMILKFSIPQVPAPKDFYHLILSIYDVYV